MSKKILDRPNQLDFIPALFIEVYDPSREWCCGAVRACEFNEVGKLVQTHTISINDAGVVVLVPGTALGRDADRVKPPI